MTAFTAPDRIGQFVRRRRPCGYRTDHWAQILPNKAAGGHEHWLVIYQDGETDLIPIHAPLGHYDFHPAPVEWRT